MDHSTYQALKLSLLLFVIALKAFLIFYLCYLANRLRLSANAAAPKRLNPSVLKEIPVLVYSAQTHDATLECAVCLSEFQDGEEARVLPACKHTFHSACVGAWLRSHSDRPLCRAPVREIRPAAGNVQRAELRREGDSGRFGSAPSYSPPARLAPLQCERIMPDLVGITVEVTVSSGVSGSAH